MNGGNQESVAQEGNCRNARGIGSDRGSYSHSNTRSQQLRILE